MPQRLFHQEECMGVQLISSINRTTNHPQIVIFQKNVASDFEELAWPGASSSTAARATTIRSIFPLGLQVGASDSHGNHTPQLEAQYGQQFQLSRAAAAIAWRPQAMAPAPTARVLNALPRGAINASCR
jgi:hypothetical protein